MKKITPFLWFDNNAEEAVAFYTSIFKNSKNGNINPGPGGKPMAVTFEIEGQELIAFNGGPYFKFNEAISLSVDCKTQEEVDDYWEKLSAGGSKGRCGWLKDKYGLSWQIVPSALRQFIGSSDAKRSQQAMAAMMKMDKLDIAALKQAYDAD